MPVLTDDEVGLGVLTDADVGLGKAEPLGPPELIGPPEATGLTPEQREVLAAEPMPPRLVMPPSTVRSTIAGGPPVPVASFAETIAEPIQVAEAMQERSMEPAIPLPRMEPVSVRPPSLPERVLATVAGLGPTTVFGPNVPVSLGRGAVNLAIGVPEFATSPVGAATTILGGGAALAGRAGQIINRFIAAGFSADMIKSLYQQGRDTIENWDKMTADEKAVAVESMAGTAGMAGMLGTHALRGRRAAVPERKPPVVEEAKPAEPVPTAPEPAPAPPAKIDLTAPAAGETVTGTVRLVEQAKGLVGETELRRRANALINDPALPESARREVAGRPLESVALETAARLTVENKWIEPAAPAAQPEVPSFAARFDPETLMQRPAWVEPGSMLDKVLGELREKNDPAIVRDIAPIWKTLTPAQRQDLAARGWVTTTTRDPKVVAMKLAQDVPPARLYYGRQAKRAIEKGIQYAPEERKVEEGVQPERERTDAQRLPAEAGPRDSVQPAAEVTPEGPRPPEAPVLLTAAQMAEAKLKIRRHYDLKRPVTDDEVRAEIANLQRKNAKGNLDDMDERLYASLSVGKQPINLELAAPPAAEAAKPAAAKEPWQMTFDELKGFLADKVLSHEGLYELENIYESNVGERAPKNSGELVDFLAEHYDKYPEDLRKDFKPTAPSTKAAKPDYVVAATEAAQAAFERLGSAERGASDLSKRKGMTKAQLARLAEYDKAVEAERQAKARARQEQQSTPGAAAGGPELPSVGAASAAPGGIPPRAAIEQLADAFAGKAPTAERLAAFVRNAFNFGVRGAKAKDALSAAVQGMKTSGTALWDALTKFQTPDDLLKAKGDLSAELETRGWRVRQFVRNVQASVPDKARRAAISKWIDAGGDDAVLAAGEAATKPEYKQAYRDARNLTADEKIQAQNIQNYFDTRLQEAIDAGVLEHGLDDYIHRIYEKDPSLIKRALAYVQSGILSKNPALAKKRLFEFDWQAEQQGFRPVQDFLPRIAAYEASLSRAIAARKFVQRMSELTAPDGRPIVGIKGVGVPLEDPVTGAREGTVIKPLGDFRKNRDETDALNYRGDYEDREFPALSKWKWVSTDAGGKPIFVQGDVAIHPDYVKRVDALLKPSSVRKYAPLRTAQAISATVKQTMLDMSFFHQVQIAVHGLEHRVNPFRLVQDIDFENPNVQGLLKGGVTLGGEYYPSNLGEGLVGRSLTKYIPGLGEILETYHGWLFQDFIPRMKLTMGLHALERNRQRYARDLASGRMSEDALHLLTAKQANAAFGELNYTMLERNKTVQDMARLVLLAPDFLEARGRFVAQALTKYGTEQRVALLLGAITMWTAARVMNKIADDQWHLEPENLFNLVYKNNAYGLRTVQGDVIHMLTKFWPFWMNRMNPAFVRWAIELGTGRDQFGRTRNAWQQLTDFVSTAMPIALRSSRERHLWESLLNSFGVTARRWNDVKNAHELASKWKKENNIREQPGEFIYDSDKDPLRPLKLALSEQDDAGAVKELKRVLDSKAMTPEQVDKYFNRYAAAPFTGSRANDVRFMASLSADDKKTVQAAQQHRRAMLELYRKTRRQLQAATQPRPAMPAGVPLPAPVPLPPMFQP